MPINRAKTRQSRRNPRRHPWQRISTQDHPPQSPPPPAPSARGVLHSAGRNGFHQPRRQRLKFPCCRHAVPALNHLGRVHSAAANQSTPPTARHRPTNRHRPAPDTSARAASGAAIATRGAASIAFHNPGGKRQLPTLELSASTTTTPRRVQPRHRHRQSRLKPLLRGCPPA